MRSISKSVSGIEEIHEISRKLEKENEEKKNQPSIGSRVVALEQQVAQLQEGRVSILKQFREMIAAVTEISEESSEE